MLTGKFETYKEEENHPYTHHTATYLSSPFLRAYFVLLCLYIIGNMLKSCFEKCFLKFPIQHEVFSSMFFSRVYTIPLDKKTVIYSISCCWVIYVYFK